MENTFGKNIIPDNDRERIAALKRYEILDTPPDDAFDRIAKLATQIFKTPVSLISLVDAERVFFKANIGAGYDREASRGLSLCALAVLSPEILVFENAPEDPCLLANPNVAAEYGVKFYAGAPLITPDNFQIGTLCVVDFAARKFSEEERLILQQLSGMVMHEIELRSAANQKLAEYQKLTNEISAANEELTTTNEELNQTQQSLQQLNDQLEVQVSQRTRAVEAGKYKLEAMVMNTPIAMAILKGHELLVEVANQPMLNVWRRKLSQVIGRSLVEIFPELSDQPNPERMRGVMRNGNRFSLPEAEVFLGTVDGVIKKHYAKFSYDPIFDADGVADSILVTVIDITEEVQNRQQLQQKNEEQTAVNLELAELNEKYKHSQDELKLAIDAASMGTFDFDPLTGRFSGNDLLKSWFGLVPEAEIELSKAVAVIAEEDRDKVNAAISKALTFDSGGDYAVQYTIIDPLHPAPRIVRAKGKALFNERFEPVRLSGVLQDVTEQSRDEQPVSASVYI